MRIGVGSDPDKIEGSYDKVFLHLHLSQLSETPSPENCGCDACWVERNDI